MVNVWGGECLGGERLTIVLFYALIKCNVLILKYVPSLQILPCKSLGLIILYNFMVISSLLLLALSSSQAFLLAANLGCSDWDW